MMDHRERPRWGNACWPVLASVFGVLVLTADRPVVAGPAQARAYYVNTTSDLPLDPQHCLPGRVCPFRRAVLNAMALRAAVRVCFEGACPPGQLPLRTDDPNYDPVTRRWTLRFNSKLQPLIIDGDGLDVDLATNVPGWKGPKDNVITLSSGITLTNHMLAIEGSGNKLAGFNIQGNFQDAAILIRHGARNNQIGPGMAFHGFPEGRAIRILDAGTSGNRVVGSWCGFRVNAQGEIEVDGLVDDCIQIVEGASDNVIGGPNEGDGNVLSASQLGFGVALYDAATRNNTIQNNFLGTDPSGTHAVGNSGGIGIFGQATNTKIVGNVISGNRNSGVLATDASTRFGRTMSLVEGNWIGVDRSGQIRVPNGSYGIEIRGLSKDVTVAHNVIMYNGAGGILVCDEQTRNNKLTENVVTANGGTGIDVCSGANGGVRPPEIAYVDLACVRGKACPGCRIEVFSDPASQAAYFEGAVTAAADGSFAFQPSSGAFRYRNVTTTATDGESTSGLSPVKVIPRPTLTPTPRPGRTATPTPLLTRTPAPQFSIYLPSLANGVAQGS